MKANPRRALRIVACILSGTAALCQSGAAGADQWPPPPTQWWSGNHRFVLRVDTDKRTLALKEQRAHGLELRWNVAYPDPEALFAAPAAAYLTDDGRHVILRDQWHELGHGKVLVFLGARGNVLRAYTLEQLLSEREILSAKLTISSIWWSENGLFFLRPKQRQFAFVTQEGTVRVFDVASGEMMRVTPGVARGVRQNAVALARKQLASADASDRITGATMVGVLRDEESVSSLKRLLRDPTWTAGVSEGGGPVYDEYGVQLAAGGALVTLLGADAVPLLEARLQGANAYMARQWKDLIEQARAPRSARR